MNTPWRVVYAGDSVYTGWHPRSCPKVVDATGEIVCQLPQYVAHPGLYDERADKLAQFIVERANLSLIPACHTGEQDSSTHTGDHNAELDQDRSVLLRQSQE